MLLATIEATKENPFTAIILPGCHSAGLRESHVTSFITWASGATESWLDVRQGGSAQKSPDPKKTGEGNNSLCPRTSIKIRPVRFLLPRRFFFFFFFRIRGIERRSTMKRVAYCCAWSTGHFLEVCNKCHIFFFLVSCAMSEKGHE